MDLKLKLYKPFVAELNRLKEKYGDEFEKINGFHNSNLNFTDFIDNFIDKETLADASIDSNSNSSLKNVAALMKEMSKPFTKLLSYNKIYYEMVKKYGIQTANEWLEAEYNGALYLHDAHDASFKPYCYNYDLELLTKKGLFFMPSLNAEPPKHWETWNNMLIEFTAYASGNQSGSVGLASKIIEDFYFYKKDSINMTEEEKIKFKKQQFQVFVYNINQEYLRTNEPSFTNVSLFDREYIYGLFGSKRYPDNSLVIDYVEEIMEFQKEFMQVVSEIREKQIFTFPILSFALLYDEKTNKFADEEFAKWAVNHNLKWMDSNFYIGRDITVLSSCCRLCSSIEDLEKDKKLEGYTNSIGNPSISIGSIKVSTVNLMRVALTSKDKEEFMVNLKKITNLNIKVLDIQRSIIARNIDKGLLPMYSYGLMDLNKQFSTIGLNSFYNTIKYMGFIENDIFGYEKWTNEGIEFGIDILNTLNKLKDETQFDYSINLEIVPAEKMAYVSALKDTILFGKDKINTELYSNQWIDLRTNATLDERIRLSGILDSKCGGGQILHVNVENRMNFDQAWDLTNKIAKNGVIYFAFTTKLKVDKNNHTFLGDKCDICGASPEKQYERIVGYYTSTNNWSKHRKEEGAKRKWYNI